MNVVFLGGGRITSALLAGFQLAKTKHRLIVHDRNDSKLRMLRKRYGVSVESNLQRAVMQAELLLIAVRPGSVKELLRTIGDVSRRILVVSLAAGIPLRALTRTLGGRARWARAMPSPVCRSARGLTALAFPRALPERDRRRVRDLFSAVGPIVEIPESRFDAFTVTYSCTHGYHALATLVDAAQNAGLDQKTALLAGAHALADGIVAWRDGEQSLEALFEEALTPGGTSFSAVSAMDAAGYRQVIRKGMAAGLRRARAGARL